MLYEPVPYIFIEYNVQCLSVVVRGFVIYGIAFITYHNRLSTLWELEYLMGAEPLEEDF